MILFHLIILAIVQGLTEFLPVSSSGHLVLVHAFAGEQNLDLCWEKNRTLDVAVHVGTLFSVFLYFRRDFAAMIFGGLNILKGDLKGEKSKLLIYVIIGSIPVILAGLATQMIKPDFLCLVEVMAWSTLIFGILLWVVDQKYPDSKTVEDLNFKTAALIGLAQILALIPGTSRSGITMTAARIFGFSRIEAARYSLLLGMVAISGAGTLGGLDLALSGNMDLGWQSLFAAFLAFLSGWLAIALMMAWLKRSSFTPFAIYRIILGIALLIGLYSNFI